MRLLLTYLLLALAAGCGHGVSSHPGDPPDAAPPEDATPPIDASPDAPPGPPPETRLLGLNDISIFTWVPRMFVEIPQIGKLNGVDTPSDLVPRALFTRLVTSHNDIVAEFDEFHIMAIRFDVCDRIAPGPCPVGVDGSLRLVFQPVTLAGGADVGLHAFYAIPAAKLPEVVNDLRRIARLADVPVSSPLDLRTFFPEPRAAIRALLTTYATPAALIRLHVMGQDARTTQQRTVFRGLELKDGQMVDVEVPTVGATQQEVTVTGVDPSYAATPAADSPAGFALTLSSSAFNAAAPADRRSALEALVATQNPQLYTSSTVQCIACHTSTYLGVHRGAVAGIDLRTLTSRFASTHDLRIVNGISLTSEASLHAASWLALDPTISQRVVNETAMALDEIEQRFPVPTDAHFAPVKGAE